MEVLGKLEDEEEIDLDAYVGTFNNSGYGTFTLCAPSSASHYCTQVLSNFTTVDSATAQNHIRPQAERKELYAAFPRLWSSHLRFVHLKGQKFLLQATNLFVEGYGSDRSPFEAMADGDTGGVMVEFVVDEVDGDMELEGKEEVEKVVRGFGMMEPVEGKTAKTARSRSGGVEERANVWFERSV